MTNYNANYNETMPFTDTSVRFYLAAEVSQDYTVPGDNMVKYKAVFYYRSDSDVFIGLNTTASYPTVGTKDVGQTIEFRPDTRYVKGGDVISAITADLLGAYFGISLWSLPA